MRIINHCFTLNHFIRSCLLITLSTSVFAFNVNAAPRCEEVLEKNKSARIYEVAPDFFRKNKKSPVRQELDVPPQAQEILKELEANLPELRTSLDYIRNTNVPSFRLTENGEVFSLYDAIDALFFYQKTIASSARQFRFEDHPLVKELNQLMADVKSTFERTDIRNKFVYYGFILKDGYPYIKDLSVSTNPEEPNLETLSVQLGELRRRWNDPQNGNSFGLWSLPDQRVTENAKTVLKDIKQYLNQMIAQMQKYRRSVDLKNTNTQAWIFAEIKLQHIILSMDSFHHALEKLESSPIAGDKQLAYAVRKSLEQIDGEFNVLRFHGFVSTAQLKEYDFSAVKLFRSLDSLKLENTYLTRSALRELIDYLERTDRPALSEKEVAQIQLALGFIRAQFNNFLFQPLLRVKKEQDELKELVSKLTALLAP